MEQFETCTFTLNLELALGLFCQSYLQDLNCLSAGRVLRALTSNLALSLVTEHGCSEAQTVKVAATSVNCLYEACKSCQGQPHNYTKRDSLGNTGLRNLHGQQYQGMSLSWSSTELMCTGKC